MSRVQGLAAILLISGGVAAIFWPAALIVAGMLLLVDRIT